MAINTPAGCREEALVLLDMMKAAEERGTLNVAQRHYERFCELIRLAERMEREAAKPTDTEQQLRDYLKSAYPT